ncbi:acetate kinase [Spiroplasma endosymbiont of Aspidapion aeneum]|uniref:acetate kinase n=1 Tax=Spiroplasma endosymbiont of Aspidapion aeneum TaxID=3066276 RepID=UPI00313C1085
MILVVNPGSSSIKFKIFNVKDQEIAQGLAERIGVDGVLTIKYGEKKFEEKYNFKNHTLAAKEIINNLLNLKIITKLDDILGVGYRIVHGGKKLDRPILIDDNVLKEMNACIDLAPLHNKAAMVTIEAFRNVLPKTKFVGCFDTSFHATIPQVNHFYPINWEYYEKYDVKRYGFHGISFEFITEKMKSILKKDNVNLIICHIGNGASCCCVKDNKSFDTTMGFTPLAGLMMGTRSGDVDPSIISYMAGKKNTTAHEIVDELNKKSGLLGVSSVSSDFRDVTQSLEKGDKKAKLAFDIYKKRISDIIVNYANQLDGKVDAVIFTAGVGENSYLLREEAIKNVKIIGLEIDSNENKKSYDDFTKISSAKSAYPIYAVRTDEELMICSSTKKIIK